MATEQKVYLITEDQRNALLAYLQERPYKEVAAGIEFLFNATPATMTTPDAEPAAEAPAEESAEAPAEEPASSY